MPHIDLHSDYPGLQGLLTYRPEVLDPINAFVQILMWDEHPDQSLSRGERQLIGTYAAYKNDCKFAYLCHGGVAAAHLDDNEELVEQVKQDYTSAPISPKLKALLAIAEQTVRGGKYVNPDLIEAARAEGATDLEIHDTVLTAAAFCLYSRYIDGLATNQPDDPEFYRELGKRLAAQGYHKTGEKLMADAGVSRG
jgi:uncharacterized peroxidase-related enzyme